MRVDLNICMWELDYMDFPGVIDAAAYICIYIYTHICIYMYIYVCVFVCVQEYVYVYIHT